MDQIHLARVSMAHVVVLLLLVVYTVGHPQYQANIPNGQNVPDPCQPPEAVWSGVGHQNPMGGGPRNPFGTDFELNNYNWTAVCPLDSDGDGRTNGQELCDPQCTWKVGDPNPTGCQPSHPGVCEPLGTADCRTRNAWLTCPEPFNCSAIHEPGVQNITLRFPPTPVPPRAETHFCHGFLLPNDNIDYHIIATTAFIKTSALLQHMMLYVCKDPPQDQTMFSTAVECGDLVTDCGTLMSIWASGMPGQCLPNEFGFRNGPSVGYKYAILKLHWSNPLLVSTLVDSSGMTLFYTPHLRPNDGGMFMMGQEDINIPPGQSSFTVSGKCPAVCTAALPQPLNIAGAMLYMHLLGKAGNLGIYRDNAKIAELLSTDSYDYNSLDVITFDPIVFQPGDEMRINCIYQSLDRNTTTVHGTATDEELCLVALYYYPIQDDFVGCAQNGTRPVCTNNFMRCDLVEFKTLYYVIRQYCNLTNCTMGCRGMVQAYHDSNCVLGDGGLYIKQFWPGAQQIYDAVSVCGLPSTTPCQP